jgi:hypothetical protein
MPEDRSRYSALAVSPEEAQAIAALRGMHLPPGANGCIEVVRNGYTVRAVGDTATIRQALQMVADAESMHHDRKLVELRGRSFESKQRQVSSDLSRIAIIIPISLILGAALWMLWSSISSSAKYSPRYSEVPHAVIKG